MKDDFLVSKLTWMLMNQQGITQPDYNNLKSLSEKLLVQKNIHLSTNTLARLTGVKKETRNHYKHTLDSLALASGFASFEHYTSLFRFKNQSYLSDISWSSADFIFSYSEKAAQNSDTGYFIALNDFISKHGCTVDTMLKLGISITKGLRVNHKPQKIIPVLVEIPLYLDLFFETYVDIDFLAKYYGNAMILLSDHSATGTRTWLFSTTLAWYYSKMTFNNNQYLIKGQLLMEYAEANAEKLLEDKCYYPYSRLMAAVILFSIEQNWSDRASSFFENSISVLNKINPDFAMVIISQISDLTFKLKKSELELLTLRFNEISDLIRFERDSFYNAAINLSVVNKKWLINTIEMKSEWEQNPIQFFTCALSLKNKYEFALTKID